MAVEKTITQSAEIVALPVGMPRVEMPLDAAPSDDFRYIVFVLDTPAGPVHVKAYWWEFECRGEAPALIAAGLTRAEWLPGLPGNQKTRQQVLFDSTGPRLHVGRGLGKKQTQPHITVCRCSSRTFVVEVPATPDQCRRLEAFHEQRQARAVARMEKEELDRAKAFLDGHKRDKQDLRLNQKPDELRGAATYALEVFEMLLSGVTAKVGVHYADDVVKEVELHLNAIRQALSCGKILPAASQYQREGNVVFFPRATDCEKPECGGMQ
jgi:hypothetical protein